MPHAIAGLRRNALRLSPGALAAATFLLAGPLEPGTLRDTVAGGLVELEAAGVVRDGELAAESRCVLTSMMAPDLHVETVVVQGGTTDVTHIWARPHAAVIGRIDLRGWVELAPTDPRSLALTVRARVGLPDAEASEPVAPPQPPVDPLRLAQFEIALAEGDHATAGALLGAGDDHSGQELRIMAALASPDRRTWRVTTRWTSGSGAERRWLSVLDAGVGTRWCSHGSEHEGDSVEPLVSPLVAASAGDLWDHLVGLLPPDTSVAPTTSPDDGTAHHGRASCPPPSPPSPTGSSGSWRPPVPSTPA
jgi:hypothetical protein